MAYLTRFRPASSFLVYFLVLSKTVCGLISRVSPSLSFCRASTSVSGVTTTRGDFLRLISAAAFTGTVVGGAGGQKATAASPSIEISAATKRKDRPGLPPESTATSAFSGLVAGAAVSTSKQLILYPIDTVKTRLQVPGNRKGTKKSEGLYRGLYNGVLPPLVVGAPSGALFFSIKDAFQTAFRNSFGDGYADLCTLAAVGLAQFPYWAVRTPAELLKTRKQAEIGREGGEVVGLSAAKAIVSEDGAPGLWRGYGPNIAYAFPADAIKFLVYGKLKRYARESKGGAKLGPVEAAVLGAGASMIAQAVTTPLDVVRTRVMTKSKGDEQYTGLPGALKKIAKEEGSGALWAGTAPRVTRSVFSGAIQFGSYEFIKGLFGVEPLKM